MSDGRKILVANDAPTLERLAPVLEPAPPPLPHTLVSPQRWAYEPETFAANEWPLRPHLSTIWSGLVGLAGAALLCAIMFLGPPPEPQVAMSSFDTHLDAVNFSFTDIAIAMALMVGLMGASIGGLMRHAAGPVLLGATGAFLAYGWVTCAVAHEAPFGAAWFIAQTAILFGALAVATGAGVNCAQRYANR